MMPPLKRELIRLIDSGRGINTDITYPGAGSPIALIANGFYGPDGMPWQRKSVLGNAIAPAFIARQTNENGFATDYPNFDNSGGTTTEVTTKFHSGNYSLRVNRTSAAQVWADPVAPFGGLRNVSGSFWLYVNALPSGGDTPIFAIVHNVGSNFYITLNSSGQIKAAQQGLVNISAAAAPLIVPGVWYLISWSHNASTGTADGFVTVNLGSNVSVNWAQAAENILRMAYGAYAFATASTFDILFDDGFVYYVNTPTTNTWTGARPWFYGEGGFMNGDNSTQLDSNGTAAALRHAVDSGSGNYAVIRGIAVSSNNYASFLDPDPVPAPGTAGINTNDSKSSLFANPFLGLVATPPAIVTGGRRTTGDLPVRDVTVAAVVAKTAIQPAGSSYVANGWGSFLLYFSATRWFLSKLVKSDATAAPGFVSLDPAPDTAFNTTEVWRSVNWGHIDIALGINHTLAPHASGTAGAYLASQCVEYFQGRVVMANMVMAPQYTVAADINDTAKFVQKMNRVCWTILPGEKPSRGPFTTNSEGLTHLQWPWSIEVNNYVDVDGVGRIYSISNMGDNQLFIIGADGCARLTGYLSTAVAGVNSATYDVRPILRSPGGNIPGCSVLTSVGVFYTNGLSVFHYDGNGITDVLYGAAEFYSGPISLTGRCGIIDDDFIWFNTNAGFTLVYNIHTRKWTTLVGVGMLSNSVKKRGWFSHQTNALGGATGGGNIFGNAGLFQQKPSRNWLTGSEQSSFGDAPWDRAGADFQIITKPLGSPGVAKRFRHVTVHYGFVKDLGGPNNFLTVKAYFGADRGWPNLIPGWVTLGDLPATYSSFGPPFTGVAEGSIPTKSYRFALDDNVLTNYFGDGTSGMGYPDQIQLSFVLAYDTASVAGAWVKIYSVELSYLELPFGSLVMAQ